MNDDHRRLSPYVRDEEALQRGIEQTALAQTRAAISGVAATQRLTPAEIEGMIAAVKGSRPTHNPYLMDEYLRFEAELWNSGNTRVWGMVDEAYQRGLEAARQLAQAQADQRARLRGLVEGWRAEACLEAIDSWERGYNAGVNGCAEELEAVLGGKE